MNALAVVRTLIGVKEFASPASLLEAVTHSPVDDRARRVVRLLGARDLLQAAVTAIHPSPTVLLGGGGVDLLHGASMVWLAMVAPERRRAALASATVAGILAGLQLTAAARVRMAMQARKFA